MKSNSSVSRKRRRLAKRLSPLNATAPTPTKELDNQGAAPKEPDVLPVEPSTTSYTRNQYGWCFEHHVNFQVNDVCPQCFKEKND